MCAYTYFLMRDEIWLGSVCSLSFAGVREVVAYSSNISLFTRAAVGLFTPPPDCDFQDTFNMRVYFSEENL